MVDCIAFLADEIMSFFFTTGRTVAQLFMISYLRLYWDRSSLIVPEKNEIDMLALPDVDCDLIWIWQYFRGVRKKNVRLFRRLYIFRVTVTRRTSLHISIWILTWYGSCARNWVTSLTPLIGLMFLLLVFVNIFLHLSFAPLSFVSIH